MSTLDLRGLRDMGEAPPEPSPEAPVVPAALSFRVRYSSPEGERFEAALVSKVLDGDERLKVARICAKLAGGVRFDLLPGVDQARINALAMLAIQLRDPPEWVERWAAKDDALLGRLAEVCADHSARYFRRDAGESPEDAVAARVAVDAPDLAGRPA